MELAQALQLLWRRKFFVALGVVIALGIGVASTKLLKKQVYATASTEMIVESPQVPLGNWTASLDPYVARASVFADLMTSPAALAAIGEASGIPANAIAATGPSTNGLAPVAQSPPTPARATTQFKLFFDQDPSLPTVEIYAQAPTTRQATALANGAVTGFGSYLRGLEAQSSITGNQRVVVRQLGGAAGGVVDPGVGKKTAAVIFVVVMLAWCAMILLVERRRQTRADSKTAFATGAADPAGDEDSAHGLTGRSWLSESDSDLEVGFVRGDGRRSTRVHHSQTAERDATPGKYSEPVSAVAEPASAPDEP